MIIDGNSGKTINNNHSPVVDVYVEHNEKSGKLVNLLVLENYLSKEFMDAHVADLDSMKFQERMSNSYIRISHQTNTEAMDGPYIAFGRGESGRVLYEATPEMSQLEKSYIDMTKFVYQCEDKAHRKVLEAIRVWKNSHPCNPSQPSTSSKLQFYRYGHSCPTDAPDTIVCQATKNNPYDHHCDGGSDISDNANFQTSNTSLRVLTHCISQATTLEKKRPLEKRGGGKKSMF